MKGSKSRSVVQKTLSHFCQQTSISGISNAGKENISLTRKSIWFLIFLAGVGATIWSLCTVILAVLKYPTTTSTYLKYEPKVSQRLFLMQSLGLSPRAHVKIKRIFYFKERTTTTVFMHVSGPQNCLSPSFWRLKRRLIHIKMTQE